MKKIQTAKLVLLAILMTGLPLLAPEPKVLADTLGSITNYSLAYGSSPYAITEGPDGNLWFTEQSGNKIGRITASGTITEYSLVYSNSAPADIVSGPDDSLWFTMNRIGYVGKITTDGTLTQYPLPSGASPLGITAGPDGDLWIADNSSNKVYRMKDTGSSTTYNLTNSDARPAFITADPVHNEVWVGTRKSDAAGGWISKFSVDGTETDYSLPTGTVSGTSGLTQGPDGNIYFIWSNSTHDYLGKITDSGTFTATYDFGSSHNLQYIRSGLDGYLWASEYAAGKVARINTALSSVTEYGTSLSSPIGIASGSDGNMWFTQYGGNTISKIGEGSYTNVDQDGDGLTASQELQQGTSDLVADTDHDGLSDYVESQWNTNRVAEFCDSSGTSCAYPDPTKRDIYAEIDWMVKPGTGGYSMEPSSTQLNAVQIVYAHRGINFHYDEGAYGGGNEVPYNAPIDWASTPSSVDFLDYKYGGDGISAQFDSANRDGIWHYIIFGYDFDASGVSGVSTAGGPDSFVSYGLIKDNSAGFGYSSLDTAIEGTILHELGHTVCLTNSSETYSGQTSSCVFDGVDNTAYSNYASSMNYLYQMQMVNYSAGTNGPTVDHNDWDALTLGDFARSGGGIHGASIGSSSLQSLHIQRLYRDKQLHAHKPSVALRIGQLRYKKPM